MNPFSNSLHRGITCALAFVALFISTTALMAQTAAPNLRTVASFGAFTGAGAIENTGLTVINGDIGTNVGSFTGFPPGIYTGAKHVADAVSLTAKNDLILAYNSLNDATNAVKFDTAISSTMGNGQVLTARTYGRGDLTTLSGTLTFDAENDPDAIFIIKIRAALNVAKNTQILLVNGARAANIYWAVDGAVSILDNTSFRGTILSNGAIHLYGGSSLEGRALAVVGAVTFASSIVMVPGGNEPDNTLIVITPATGESVERNSTDYQITWGGAGIGETKTFEYSLDSGATWTMIGTTTTDSYAYDWDVPDTVSSKALVRITDQNDLRGISGMFSIVEPSATDTIIVVRPAAGESITGGTQNYQITWSGSSIAPTKRLDYSLDSGATWRTIATVTGNTMTYSWNVPDSASEKALVRITDANNLSDVSGMFRIVASPPANSLIVVRPAAGESITRAAQNYRITWSGSGIGAVKTFEYSLDNGATWTVIDVTTTTGDVYEWDVPNMLSDAALVRITDENNLRGVSGLFRIVDSAPMSSIIIVRPATGEIVQGGSQDYQIVFTETNTTPQKLIEYSIDGGETWVVIGSLNSDATTFTWADVPNVATTRALIRITDDNDVVGVSGMFIIRKDIASVSDESSLGYAVSSYPNPTGGQVRIDYFLPIAGDITVMLVDGMGRQVATLVEGRANDGAHSITFDTSRLAPGVYAYVLQSGTTRIVGRMTIVR